MQASLAFLCGGYYLYILFLFFYGRILLFWYLFLWDRLFIFLRILIIIIISISICFTFDYHCTTCAQYICSSLLHFIPYFILSILIDNSINALGSLNFYNIHQFYLPCTWFRLIMTYFLGIWSLCAFDFRLLSGMCFLLWNLFLLWVLLCLCQHSYSSYSLWRRLLGSSIFFYFLFPKLS